MEKKLGARTYRLPSCPAVVSYASAVGKKEGEGPLGKRFDQIFPDTKMGESTWEKAESAFQKPASSRSSAPADRPAFSSALPQAAF